MRLGESGRLLKSEAQGCVSKPGVNPSYDNTQHVLVVVVVGCVLRGWLDKHTFVTTVITQSHSLICYSLTLPHCLTLFNTTTQMETWISIPSQVAAVVVVVLLGVVVAARSHPTEHSHAHQQQQHQQVAVVVSQHSSHSSSSIQG